MQLNKTEMTPQEVFDKVAAAIIKQGKPSMFEGVCFYRQTDDLDCSCGLGHLIPDDLYIPALERHGASYPAVYDRLPVLKFTDEWLKESPFSETEEELEKKGVYTGAGSEFYSRLQDCHDEAAWECRGNFEIFIEGFKLRLRMLAEDANLDPAIIDAPIS